MAFTGHGLFAESLGETVVLESQSPSICQQAGPLSQALGASDFLSPQTSDGFKPVT